MSLSVPRISVACRLLTESRGLRHELVMRQPRSERGHCQEELKGPEAGWLMVELADQGYTFHTFALCDGEL